MLFPLFAAGPALGMVRGGWLGHALIAALHLHLSASLLLLPVLRLARLRHPGPGGAAGLLPRLGARP